jgi:RNA polymerase sigma-32 factor
MTEQSPALSRMARKAMTAEMLDAETELMLARAWRDRRDEAALHRLVKAYMRLAVSMAGKYRRYGAPLPDLVQEAGVGLMRAAEKFDPDRGVRFSTYAVWWIKASIQDYVMRNWSLVRTGSTSAQKALFFNLRRVRAKLEREASRRGEMLDSHTMRAMVAAEMGLPLRDVELMDARLSGSDFSLNATQAGEDGREWVETIEDDGPIAEETVARQSDMGRLRGWLTDALVALNGRERMIIIERQLKDEPRTLESLGIELGLSKERIRQLEAQALKKMRKRLEAVSGGAAQALAGA